MRNIKYQFQEKIPVTSKQSNALVSQLTFYRNSKKRGKRKLGKFCLFLFKHAMLSYIENKSKLIINLYISLVGDTYMMFSALSDVRYRLLFLGTWFIVCR